MIKGTNPVDKSTQLNPKKTKSSTILISRKFVYFTVDNTNKMVLMLGWNTYLKFPILALTLLYSNSLGGGSIRKSQKQTLLSNYILSIIVTT